MRSIKWKLGVLCRAMTIEIYIYIYMRNVAAKFLLSAFLWFAVQVRSRAKCMTMRHLNP